MVERGYNKATMIIPVQLQNQGAISLSTPDKMEELTLQLLGVTEANLEEFVRKNIGLLFPEGETLLVVGQQLRNQQGGRSDLVAVDGDGNIVLIELKRDASDIVARREAFEFQAIRYAANYALLANSDDLVHQLFAPYVSKHLSEFSGKYPNLTASEIAAREIADFLAANKADKDFNRNQLIVLIASSFDPQTLSACAWLAKSGIDIRCISLTPLKYAQQYFLSVERIIPPPALEEFFVEVASTPQASSKTSASSSRIARQSLPKMLQLWKWGLIKPGDTLYISTSPQESATVKDDKLVTYQSQDMTFNAWGQKITGWSAINIYEWAVKATDDPKTNKTLDTLRREKVQEFEQAASVSDTGL